MRENTLGRMSKTIMSSMFDLKDWENLLDVNEKELETMIAKAQSISWQNFGKKIRFYAPSFIYYKTDYYCSSPSAFPSISVTGSSCALKCKHCDGRVLNMMFPALSPKELVSLCTRLKKEGAIGCLISGGCLLDGSVPLDRFIDAIAEVKRNLDLTVVVHTGVISRAMADKLKEAEVDAALIDIIGSDETIKEVYQLNMKVDDYDKSLALLDKVGIPFVPHVLVGLHYGKLKGEFQALQMISKYQPSAVIVIALMPINGTPMENVKPPTPEDIAKVLLSARLMLPKTPLVLGCMRPKGEHRVKIDTFAVKIGVNAIAFPAKEAVKLVNSMDLETVFSSLCCSQIFEDIQRSSF